MQPTISYQQSQSSQCILVVYVIMAALAPPPDFWAQVEPDEARGGNGGAPLYSCYSTLLQADVVPGTFVLLGGATPNVVARIVKVVGSFSVEVNIFKMKSELMLPAERRGDGISLHHGIVDNHLQHIPEVIQTTELRIVSMVEISNLAFVFTESALQDTANLYCICQGMAIAFVVRYRAERRENDEDFVCDNESGGILVLTKIPSNCCLPFPSCYKGSKYPDCFPRRVWNNIITVKLEMTKLLGRYSQQQGLFGRECARLYLTAETWGFIRLQCSDILSEADFASSKRFRVHRVVESGLVVKAARVQKECTIMRFSTKQELRGLCRVFGESMTAGQRCRLPKSSKPKSLLVNDIINVVCGSDVREPGFIARTACDGIDLEFDGVCEMFITIRYSRYAFTRTTTSSGCDPLLYSLICRCDPYKNDPQDQVACEHNSNTDNEIFNESEFEDEDGHLYRVTKMSSSQIIGTCIYPKRNNPMYGCDKSFDHELVKTLVRQRLNG